jgi:putative transposase
MLKAFKYRLYPNSKQVELFSKHFGCSRFIYNWALELKNNIYTTKKKSLSRYEISDFLPKLKQENIWLKEINSQILQQSLMHLDTAFTRFFKKQADFPVFKSRKDRQSFSCPQNVKVNLHNSTIILPKIPGEIKCVFSREFTGKIKTCTISRNPARHYFISILVETPDKIPIKPKIDRSKTVGIDLGLKDFLITSNGEKIPNPRFNQKEQKKIARLNRQISRQYLMNDKKHSKNRTKTCLKRAIVFERVNNRRKDFHHKISTKLIRENQTICLEDLAVSNMMKNHKVAESFASVGLGTFIEYLKYKAEWYGRNLIFIGRFDPSSKMCSSCGHIYQELSLSERYWTCSKCNTHHDRDINAAINIKNFALQKQNLIAQVELNNRKIRLNKPEIRLDKPELTLQNRNKNSVILTRKSKNEIGPLLKRQKDFKQARSLNEESTPL